MTNEELRRIDARIAEFNRDATLPLAVGIRVNEDGNYTLNETGGGLVAWFNHGRVTYDNKRLDGLALAFPQINECKKTGDPFVVLKPVKG